MKTSIISGISGQDGAYLALLLLERGYKVYGTHRPGSFGNFWRLEELGIRNHPDLHLIAHELTELDATVTMVEQTQPDEIYNFAAQSSVARSFEQPYLTAQITGVGALNLLEAIRRVNARIRFFQASSADMFGTTPSLAQSEDTPFYPRSPYAVAKLGAHWSTVNYRESYNIFACSGILFNHESPLRGLEFVTRKISHGAARIKLGKLDLLELGNLDIRRDWGFAKEYVEGMWRMLQADKPDTFVLASKRSASVRDFVRMAFKHAGIEVEFSGRAENETAVVTALSAAPSEARERVRVGQTVLRVNPKFYRPLENGCSVGDPAKARAKLGWETRTTPEQLCQMMVDADLARVGQD